MAGHDMSQRDSHLTVDADVVHLGRLREHVATIARDTGANDDIVDQLQLVVSELATNAMQNSMGAELTVGVEGDGSSWTIDVSNADGLSDMTAPTLPEPSALSGRGLFLVDAVMDRVELVELHGKLHVRCVKFAG